MLNFFKRKKNIGQPGVVLATQDGELLPISEMPDPIFADKTLGEGICILPTDNRVYAPVDGYIDNIAHTGHALGIVSTDGAELMIHIGVETVALKGKGFQLHVKAGQSVKAGDLLCEADVAFIRASGCLPHTAVVVTNADRFVVSEISPRRVKACKDIAFRFAGSGDHS